MRRLCLNHLKEEKTTTKNVKEFKSHLENQDIILKMFDFTFSYNTSSQLLSKE